MVLLSPIAEDSAATLPRIERWTPMTYAPPPPEPAPEATPRRSSILAGLASYLDSATIVTTSIALVLYEKPLHLSSWTIGAVSALLTLSIAVGALVGGRLGDLLGRKRVYAVDLVVYGVGVALLLGILVSCLAGSGLLGALVVPRLALSRATTPWAGAPKDQPMYRVPIGDATA
jgi:hypothetical protein